VSTYTYVIQRGDTLSAIARRWHTSVAELARLNNISDPNRIYVGRTLRIPSNEVPRQSPRPSGGAVNAPTRPGEPLVIDVVGGEVIAPGDAPAAPAPAPGARPRLALPDVLRGWQGGDYAFAAILVVMAGILLAAWPSKPIRGKGRAS